MKKILILFIILLSVKCFSQSRTVTGKVVDSKTNLPVKNANIVIFGSTQGTFTNEKGYFQLKAKFGYKELLISHVNYETGKIQIPDKNQTIKILINPAPIYLYPIDLFEYPKPVQKVEKEKVHKLENVVFQIVEENARFSLGERNFYILLGNKIKSSKTFSDKNFEALVNFTVNTEGKIENIIVSPETTDNKNIIIESLKSLGNWIPAAQRQENVPQKHTITIFYEGNINEDFEIPALPKGGINEFYKFVAQNMIYPRQAKRMGIEGRVEVEFIIDKDGSLKNPKIVRGIGAGCDEEVLRIINIAPNWIPAKEKGKAVKQKMTMPINFSLGDLIPATKNENTVDVEPSFPGGKEKRYKYIKKNKKAMLAQVPPNPNWNRVQLKFKVDISGNIKDIEVVKSLGNPFDQEAIRLFSSMPKWSPALKDGKPVERSVYSFVSFEPNSVANIQAADRLYNTGLHYKRKGKYEKALSYFTKTIEKNHTFFYAYFNRALMYIQLDKIDKACEDLVIIKDQDKEALEIYNKYCNQ